MDPSKKLTPDLAGKILKADFKNIIDKVGKGKPLSGPERAIFDELKIETEDLQRRRQLALVGKWAGGKRLSDSELCEIADLLPSGSLFEEPPPPEKKPSGRASKTGFKEGYGFYAGLFEASERTVKRWVKVGKDASDPCPLDEPVQMRGWWSRNMKLRCPPGVLAAEVKALKEQGKEPPPEENAPPPPPVVDLESEERGLAGALARLEQMEVTLAGRGAEAGGTKPWLDTISRMTSLATKLRQELEAEGKLVPKEQVAYEIQSFHGEIVSVLKSVLSDDQCREVFELLGREVFS